MGKLDKLIKEAGAEQERRNQQQSGEAVSPPFIENQEHKDTATSATETQTQQYLYAPVSSWWKRVRDRMAGSGRVRPSAEAAEKMTEPTCLPDADAMIRVAPLSPERLKACCDLSCIRRDIAAYETAIAANERIIKETKKLYDDDSEYVREVTDITKDVDHRRLATTNQLAQANISLLAHNLYALAPVTRLANEDIVKAEEAVRAEIVARVDQVTADTEETQQEAKEEVKQTATPSPGNGNTSILKDVAMAVLFFLTVAFGAAYFTKDSGHEVSHAGSPDAQSTIDSLKAVIASKNKELATAKGASADYYLLRLKYDKMAGIKSREQADVIFGYKDLLQHNKQLQQEKVKLELEIKDWSKAYNQLKAVTDGYAAKDRGNAEQSQEQPRREKAAFNSIEGNKNANSPYSPQSY